MHSYIPAYMHAGSCSSLLELSLDRNQVPELPEALTRLTKLQVIKADSNRCAEGGGGAGRFP